MKDDKKEDKREDIKEDFELMVWCPVIFLGFYILMIILHGFGE